MFSSKVSYILHSRLEYRLLCPCVRDRLKLRRRLGHGEDKAGELDDWTGEISNVMTKFFEGDTDEEG